MNGRILAIDPGDKRIGLAVSDPSGTIANPLMVIEHISRMADAARIVQTAEELDAVLIVVGQPLDADGRVGPQARKALRLVQAIQSQTQLPVEVWDESGSTQEARSTRLAMGVNRRKRSGHLDALAAVVILQSFLDSHTEPQNDIP